MSTNSHQPVFPVPAPGCESTLPSILFLGSLLSCSQLSQPSALSSPGSQLSWFFALSLLSTLISVLSLFLPRSPLCHFGRRSLSSSLSLLSAFFPFPLLFSSALLCLPSPSLPPHRKKAFPSWNEDFWCDLLCLVSWVNGKKFQTMVEGSVETKRGKVSNSGVKMFSKGGGVG